MKWPGKRRSGSEKRSQPRNNLSDARRGEPWWKHAEKHSRSTTATEKLRRALRVDSFLILGVGWGRMGPPDGYQMTGYEAEPARAAGASARVLS